MQLKNASILVIDDDTDVLTAVRLLLKTEAKEVLIEKNPENIYKGNSCAAGNVDDFVGSHSNYMVSKLSCKKSYQQAFERITCNCFREACGFQVIQQNAVARYAGS